MEPMIYVMAALGILGHLVSKLVDSLTTKTAFNWKQHLLFSLYSVIILAAVLIGGGQVVPGLETMTPWTAFLMGFFSDSLVKNFSSFNPFKTS